MRNHLKHLIEKAREVERQLTEQLIEYLETAELQIIVATRMVKEQRSMVNAWIKNLFRKK